VFFESKSHESERNSFEKLQKSVEGMKNFELNILLGERTD